MGRKRRQQAPAFRLAGRLQPDGEVHPDDEGGFLQIGGVVVSAARMPSRAEQRAQQAELRGAGPAPGPSRPRRGAPPPEPADSGSNSASSGGSSDLDEELLDYLANVEAGSEGDEDDHAALLAAMQRFGARGVDEYSASAGSSDSDSTDDSEQDLAAALGLQPLTEQEVAELAAADPGCTLLVDTQGRPLAPLEQLELSQRYPVLARQPVAGAGPSSAAEAAAAVGRRKQRSVVRGAQGGKLLPGEKKKLRKEGIQAKRAAREAWRGFDAEAVAAHLRGFVEAEGDMMAFDPCGKVGLAMTRQLAACFRLKSSIQGKGNGRRVVVVSTPNTCLPEDTSTHSAQLAKLLTDIRKLQQSGAAKGAGVSPAGMAADRRERQCERRRPSSGGLQRLQSSTYQQPVAFVSGGVLNPGSSPSTMQPAAASAGVAAPPFADAAAACEPEQLAGAQPGVTPPPAPALSDAARFVQGLMLSDDGASSQPGATDSDRSADEGGAERSGAADARMSDGEQLPEEGEAAEQLHLGLGYHAASEDGAHSLATATLAFTAASMQLPPPPSARQPRYQVASFSLGLDGGSGEGVAAAGPTGAEQAPAYQPAGFSLGLGFDSMDMSSAGSAVKAAARDAEAVVAQLAARSAAQGRREAARAPQPAAPMPRGSVRGTSLLAQHARPGDVPTPQLTKQQAKATAKKAAKEERRRQRRGEADAMVGGITELGARPPEQAAAGASATFGDFEQHTSGIGSRLMASMGWSAGEGLGRGRQGRAEPVQATRRPKQLGLGA